MVSASDRKVQTLMMYDKNMASDLGNEGVPIPEKPQEQKAGTNNPRESPTTPDIKPLYRGVWMDVIKEGDRIPVGGNRWSDTLDILLEVDTSWMDEKTESFTRERVEEFYNSKNGEGFRKLVEDSGIKVEPELLHALYQVQMKMRGLLSVGDSSVAEARHQLYFSQGSAKLSDFVGNSECAEQAVVGKLLLDKIGLWSSLMEGVHVDGKDYFPNDHTFLVLDDPQGEGSLIFDIARPKASLGGYPRILRTEQKFEYSNFEGKNNYVVPAKDVYNDTTLYYGVGNPELIQDVNFAN